VQCSSPGTTVPIDSQAVEISLLRSSVEDAHKRGFATLVLKPHSKEPHPKYSPHGVHSSTKKLSDALRPYDEGVAANYGVDCGASDITVVDVDRGLKSLEHLNSWMQEFNLPSALTVKSGREGGFHLYYARAVPSTNFNLGGVTGDIIGIGRYVAGPGSNHPDGEKYEIVYDVPLAAFPAEVFKEVKTKKEKSAAVSRPIPKGQRNAELTSIAGSLRNSGIRTEDEMYAILREIAILRCEDGPQFVIEEEKAIRSLARRAVTDFDTKKSLVVIRGDEAPREELKYISEPFLPAKLCGLAGNSSEAKSPITRDMAACITRGLTFPDRRENPIGPRSVLMLNAEDDLNDTIMPSLDAMGADDSKFYYIKGTKVWNKGDECERQFAFDKDIRTLFEFARKIPDLGLIIIDPIQNYIGDIDQNNDAEMRTILVPCSELAKELGMCIVTVHHLNSRDKGTFPLHRIQGAKALHAVARYIYMVGADRTGDVTDKHRHILTQARGTTGNVPSMRYRTVKDERKVGSQTLQAIKIEWTGQTDATAQDAVDPVSTHEVEKTAEYGEIINELLQHGPKLSSECRQRLKEAGWEGNSATSESAIKRRAKAESRRIDGQAFWALISEVNVGNHNDIHSQI